LEGITAHAEKYGLKIEWARDGDLPVALIRYQPGMGRHDIILEQLQVLDGQILLSGRSESKGGSAAVLTLPRGRILHSAFPRRKPQAAKDPVFAPVSMLHSNASPTSR